MKLDMFKYVTIRTKKYLLVKELKIDKSFEVLVPFSLIEHSNRNVLFDTGRPLSVFDCAVNI